MKWGFLATALAAALLNAGASSAQEAWEQALLDQGWVKVEAGLKELADTTWYGLKNEYSDKTGVIRYIHRDGVRISEKINHSNYKDSGIRTVRGDRICVKWNRYPRLICKTAWKKGDIYMLVPDNGPGSTFFSGDLATLWKVKKGNPEQFRSGDGN